MENLGKIIMSKLNGKNILVTGATGLVGSHLVERLLSMDTGRIITLSRSRDPEAYFFKNSFDKKVVMASGDLKDRERIADIITKYEINYIFHIAAQPIVATAFINPYETLATNIMGTVHILEAAKMSPYIEGVVAASSEVWKYFSASGSWPALRATSPSIQLARIVSSSKGMAASISSSACDGLRT